MCFSYVCSAELVGGGGCYEAELKDGAEGVSVGVGVGSPMGLLHTIGVFNTAGFVYPIYFGLADSGSRSCRTCHLLTGIGFRHTTLLRLRTCAVCRRRACSALRKYCTYPETLDASNPGPPFTRFGRSLFFSGTVNESSAEQAERETLRHYPGSTAHCDRHKRRNLCFIF